MEFFSLNHFNYIKFVPIILLFMLIGGCVAAIFIKPHEFKTTRTYVFISITTSIAVLILVFNVFLTTVNLEEQKKINDSQFTKQVNDKLWILPNQLLTEKIHARPEFLASFYYNNLVLYQLTKSL